MKADYDPFDMQRFLSVMPLFSDLSNEERTRLARVPIEASGPR